jgi:hypothetical protein
VPKPLESWENDDAFVAHMPKVIIVEPQIKGEWIYSGNKPISLELAEISI